MKKAVFLDRDGTINVDPGYISDPNDFHLLPKAKEALQMLAEAGFELIIVTNQSGVARGSVRLEALNLIHQKLDHMISPAKFARFMACLHHPDENCECRKPKPKMILDAAKDLGVDLTQSYMVGDRDKDLQAGRSAGCKAVAHIRNEKWSEEYPNDPGDFTADNLYKVAEWIIEDSGKNSGADPHK